MKRVLVLFGGGSVEKDISVITAIEAIGNIDTKKYKVYPIYIADKWYFGNFERIEQFCPFDEKLYRHVALISGELFEIKGSRIKRMFKPDAALICTHGGVGENGSLQGLLEANEIPYTSAGVLQSAIGMDKAVSKQIFEGMILNVPKYFSISKSEYEQDKQKTETYVETFIDYPIVVKPCSQGSSIGISVAHDRAELERGLELAFCYGEKAIVEKEIENFVEVNCACYLKDERIIVSETERPIADGEILSFADKYVGGDKSKATRISPADVGDEINELIKATSKRVYCETGLKGVVRFDYLVSGGKIYINEMNTVPGALANYLFKPLGIDYTSLISDLIEEADYESKNIKFDSGVLAYYSGNKVGAKGNTAKPLG